MQSLQAALPNPPPPPPGTPAMVTQKGVANRELDELHAIQRDGESLRALVSAGLEQHSLEDTASLERLSELSTRLLCRNRARAAAAKFAHAILSERSAPPSSPPKAPGGQLDTAASTLLPAYFRHTQNGGADEDGGQVWVSKVYLHALPGGAPGTALCVRFSLKELEPEGGDADESLYDLSVQAQQVAPFEAGASRFTFSFGFQDKRASAASEFTLDEAHTARLAELQALLGLAATRCTAYGALGFLLAGVACGQLEGNACFDELLRALREAHRAELLAASGSLF
jgi:hypothetical protein